MVTAKLEACMLAVDLSVLPSAKLVPILIQLGELEHVDFKEYLFLFKTLTQVKSGASVDLNPRPIDLQFATLTTRPLCSISHRLLSINQIIYNS